MCNIVVDVSIKTFTSLSSRMLLLKIVFVIVLVHLFELDDVIVDILCVRSAIILHGGAALRNLVLCHTRIIFKIVPMLILVICNDIIFFVYTTHQLV